MKTHLTITTFLAVACLTVAFFSGCNKDKDQQPAANSNVPSGPVKATVDTVGTKGKNRGGYLSTVVAERYRAQDKLGLMMVDYNLKLYQASNGRLPDDMDEFRLELVDNPQYAVQLPELPEGVHYEYDPKEGPLGTLWVVPDNEGKTSGDDEAPGDQ